MSEILDRARHLFVHNWLVTMVTWVLGMLATGIVMGVVQRVIFLVAGGMVVAGQGDKLWMPILVQVLAGLSCQAVTQVAVIRGIVYDGGDAWGHGWRNLHKLAANGAAWGALVFAAVMLGPIGLPLMLVGVWGFLLAVTDIAIAEQPTWGFGAVRTLLLDNAGEVLPAIGVGSIALGAVYAFSLLASVWLGLLMGLPLMVAALCLSVAIHQHVFGDPAERYELERMRQGDTYMSGGDRSLPSYLQAADDSSAAVGGGAVAAQFGGDSNTPVTPAAPAGLPSGVFTGALMANAPWGDWIGIGQAGLVELRLTWADGQAPFALNVATKEGQWLSVPALGASPAVVTLQLDPGWYYVHLQHAVDLPTPRGYHLAWRQVGVRGSNAAAA